MLKFNNRLFITIFLLIGCIVFFANSVKAEEKKFYVGLGASHQGNNYDFEDVVDWDEGTWGINAKFGYRLTPVVSFQFDVDWIPEVEGVLKSDPSLGGEVAVYTGIFSLKGYFPTSKPVKPFIIVGAGIMHYDIELNSGTQSLGAAIDDKTDLCLKIGGGLDVFINQSFSIGLEGNYTAGNDKVDAIEFWNFILGAAYHF
ncbi:MAG: porin family protein [Desulfobacteraceae bacterium]|nr:porin family protein [Desulfobacteraceae bacterium]MDH3838199.1 porin family protein [Desulfobacteraceae bacterium]MDH3875884.1 porin family protein [Desulfobacteraceae bacterium]